MSARYPQHLLTAGSLPACPARPDQWRGPRGVGPVVVMVANPLEVDCLACREILRQERVCPTCRAVDGHVLPAGTC